MQREWRRVPSIPEYEASSDGLVRKACRVRGKEPVILKPWLNSKGYQVVGICVDGKCNRHFIHRLVCEAFNGEAPDGYSLVDHRDGNPKNNSRENLRWCDQAHNMANSRSNRPGLRGVVRKRNRWAAYGSRNARSVYLGTFDTETEAACAYDRFASGQYGQFAILNFKGNEIGKFTP